MTSEQLWRGLDADVHTRLCECRNTRADILPLAVCVSINKDYTVEQALEYVLEHLSCNGQFFDLSNDEWKALEWAIESKARLPKAKKSEINSLVGDLDDIIVVVDILGNEIRGGTVPSDLGKRVGDIGKQVSAVRNKLADMKGVV